MPVYLKQVVGSCIGCIETVTVRPRQTGRIALLMCVAVRIVAVLERRQVGDDRCMMFGRTTSSELANRLLRQVGNDRSMMVGRAGELQNMTEARIRTGKE